MTERIYRTSIETNELTQKFIEEGRERAQNGDFLGLDIKNQLSIFRDYPITPVTNGLVTILGYTGHAKTTLAKIIINQFCYDLKDDNDIIVYINYEESLEELGLKDVTRMSMVSPSDVIRGNVSDEEYIKMKGLSSESAAKPIWTIADSIYDMEYKPQPNLEQIAQQLMMIRQREKRKIRLVVIDYFQLIPLMIRNPSREGHSKNARILQRLGNIIGCPILVASQTNRNPQDRNNKIPKLYDAAETSAVEKSSRAVYGVYMPWIDKEDIGDTIKINGKEIEIKPDLFIIRLLKQKHNPYPLTIPCYIDFQNMQLLKASNH